jgi:endonuclease YncB( thermonuclease family)
MTSLVGMQTEVGWDAPRILVPLKTWFRRTVALAALLLACLCLPVTAATYTGRVVGISDGDTLTVLDAEQRQRKIRLAGIDAPEKRQAWGQRAQQFLGDRVFQRVVRIEVSKKDRYGREIGKVLLDGEDINLELVRAGLAWHYRAYEREQPPEERGQYAEAEQQARERGLGLWSDTHPVAPWDFRRRARSGS